MLEAKLCKHCKTLFLRHILALRFPYVENLLHFNLADFPVSFIKQFVSCFFWCLGQILLSKFLSYYCLHYILPRILRIVSRKCWYSMQINLWWWAVLKMCVYLILRFYPNHRNLMLTKHTCFTVVKKSLDHIYEVKCSKIRMHQSNACHYVTVCAFWQCSVYATKLILSGAFRAAQR